MKSMPQLSNCYVPIPKPLPEIQDSNNDNISSSLATQNERNQAKKKEQIVLQRKEKENRNTHELRRITIQSNIIKSVSGSALVEFGNTKVLCTVVGPVTSSSSLLPSSVQLNMDKGIIYVETKYLPYSYPHKLLMAQTVGSIESTNIQQQSNTINRKDEKRNIRTNQLENEIDISNRILTAIQSAIPLHPYPKCAIIIRLTILQDDGSIIPTCLTAISIALTQSSIESYDVITSCTVAIFTNINEKDNNNMQKYKLLVDPTLEEMIYADSIVTIGLLPNWKEVTLWEQNNGNYYLSNDITNQAIQLCRDGCRTIHKFIREHLISNY